MHKHMKADDGKYHINGKVFDILVGSRAQVHHGTAYKTSYGRQGLTKNALIKNKHGRFVSKKKHQVAKKEKRLEKYGFFAVKGKFGMVKGSPKDKKRPTKKNKKNKKNKKSKKA